MSGSRVIFFEGPMTQIVQAVVEVRRLIGERPVVVGGLAVMGRLTLPYRATVDLDVVDRGSGHAPYLEMLRRSDGTESVEPAAVRVPTSSGMVRVDVLAVNQAEIDHPSDDSGDRLFATSHGWAHDSATDLTIQVAGRDGAVIVEATTPVALPGPLVAMKLQSIANRSSGKAGTDLLDIVRLTLDSGAGPQVRDQLRTRDMGMKSDIAEHVSGWFGTRLSWSLDHIHRAAGSDVSADDLDLVRELLLESCALDSSV